MVSSILSKVTAIVLGFLAVVPGAAAGQAIKVTLLGTGAPPPAMERFGPSILLEAGGQKFLFDAGRVLSGDTRVSENLVRHAQGVDLLIHEVVSPETFQRAGVRPERAKTVIEHHVTPEQAGEVFEKTRPKLAVYSHIVQPIATEQDLIPPTRKTYSGPVEVGEDLMVIEVGETIQLRRPRGSSP